MHEINEELLDPGSLWEVHMGLGDELEMAQRNRRLFAEHFGEKSEIAFAAIAIEVAIRGLRAELLLQISDNLKSGKTMAAEQV